MPRLIWTAAALRDVARLHGFLAGKHPEAARRAVGTIRLQMQHLAAHPGIGRPAEGMAPEFREWPIPFGDSGYVALYRYDGEQAAVLTVRHQREAGFIGD